MDIMGIMQIDTIALTFNKRCGASKLTDEIVASGFPRFPEDGYKLIGIETTETTTTVHLIATVTQAEKDTITNIVNTHVFP